VLQSHGKNTFTLKQARENFSEVSPAALSLALNRLSRKNKIVSVSRGFYVIIPPQNSNIGIIPPALFINSLMKHLNKPYYVGLLSAAAFHGASHQRPQEFFVINLLPAIRPIEKMGIKINFIGRMIIPFSSLEERKTEAGYIKVSNPELTALDILQYSDHIGGLSRAATVIDELSETMHADKFTEDLIFSVPVVMIQRLGYILDRIIGSTELAEAIYKKVTRVHPVLTRKPLKAGRTVKGFATDSRWKLIINVEIETDL